MITLPVIIATQPTKEGDSFWFFEPNGWMEGLLLVIYVVRKPEIIMIVIGSVQVVIVCGHGAQLGVVVRIPSVAGRRAIHPLHDRSVTRNPFELLN